MKIKKEFYEVEGCKEACFNVYDSDNTLVARIAKCYHYIGSDSLYITTFISGTENGTEEIRGDFDLLSKFDIESIVRGYSPYIY